MQLVSKKNTLIILAALLLVAFGYMAITLTKRPNVVPLTEFDKEIQNLETQSDSDYLDSIEKDLEQTDISEADKELQDIESELEATY